MRSIFKSVRAKQAQGFFALSLLVLGLAQPLTASGGGVALAQGGPFIAQNGGAGDAGRRRPPQIFLPAYVTYWAHDAVGYHPAIILAIESDGVTNMAGVPIQLQAQFRVLAEGLLTIGRTTTSFAPENTQRQLVTKPMQGKRAFELPLDQAEWPVIECKVMAKVGDASSDDSQVLLDPPCKVQSLAMTEDDAVTQLNFKLGSMRRSKNGQIHSAVQAPPPPRPTQFPMPPKAPEEKPLVAVAGVLGGPAPKAATKPQESFDQYFQKANLPGLGDDFYNFEQVFSKPFDYDNRDRDWVWAGYRTKNPYVTVYGGSRAGQGKADVIITAIDTDSTLSDAQFATIARALSSKFKSEKMAAAEHSVRYTPGGRVELTNISAQSYRAVYFTVEGNQNKLAIVAVSRQPGSLTELLKDEGHKTALLHFLLKGLGEGGQ